MTENKAIHICRNPYGHSAGQRKEAKLVVCERLEAAHEAYENMRDFAVESGLDVTAYHGPTSDEDIQK